MKNLQLYLIIGLLTFFMGCSSSSDDEIPQEPVATVVDRPVDRSANLLAAGDSANDILSNDSFDAMRVEIAYVVGFRPTQDAMDEFVAYLRRHTFKEEIEIVFTELESPEEEELTIQQIANIETENRTVYNDGETIGIYIYFADAPSEGDEEDEGLVTLGAVYRNTSMVIYESTVRRLGNFSTLISDADIETATLNHEFGHLFGLVNLGTPAINDHEDIIRDDDDEPVLDSAGNTMGNSHCNVPGCLMQAQLQFGGPSSSLLARNTFSNTLRAACSLSGKSVLAMLESRNATGRVSNAVPLDPECILDIQTNGGR